MHLNICRQLFGPGPSRNWTLVVRLLLLLWLIGTDALAHGVADDDKTFIEQSTGMQLIPYIYLGAKHMVTGYDHLLFLFGVVAIDKSTA